MKIDAKTMITRNESMMASLLTAAIDDGFRLAVKDGKLYMVDMTEPDLGGYPLCSPLSLLVKVSRISM